MSERRREHEDRGREVLRSIEDYDRLVRGNRTNDVAEPTVVGERAAELILRNVAHRLAASGRT